MAVGGVNSSVRKPGVPGGSYLEVEGESIEITQQAEQDPWWSPGDGVEAGDAGSQGSAGGGGVSAPGTEPPLETPTEPPPVEVATKPDKTGVDPAELDDTVKKKGYPKEFADRESVNDIEAYRNELANAKANGLPQEHIDYINKQIGLEMQFLQRLDPAYYDQVRDGNYQLRPEDRQQISD